jgi:hypothetical protein
MICLTEMATQFTVVIYSNLICNKTESHITAPSPQMCTHSVVIVLQEVPVVSYTCFMGVRAAISTGTLT